MGGRLLHCVFEEFQAAPSHPSNSGTTISQEAHHPKFTLTKDQASVSAMSLLHTKYQDQEKGDWLIGGKCRTPFGTLPH